MNKRHQFIKKCSTSVLAAYLLALAVLAIAAFFDKSIEWNKFAAAISASGMLIISGELFCSPFVLYSSLRSACNDFAIGCRIHQLATDTNRQFIDDKKAEDWLVNKEREALEMEKLHAVSEKSDTVLFYFGNLLTLLGFSSLILGIASKKFYELVSLIQSDLTVISFIFLMVGMSIKEWGEYTLENVYRNKERISRITNLRLQEERQNRGDKE